MLLVFLLYFLPSLKCINSVEAHHYNEVDSHVKFPDKLKYDDHLPSTLQLVGDKHKLGLQRRSNGKISHLLDNYQHKHVWRHHIQAYRPALLRNGLNNSMAKFEWNDEYLSEKYGNEQVLVERRIENRKFPPRRMKLDKFLKGYKENNWYVVTLLPNVMRKDILIPRLLTCSTFRNNLQELNLWIGSNGTRSLLHYDADHIVHCLVSGRKDWILIDRKYKDKLDMKLESRTTQASGHSHINVDEVNIFEHGNLYQIPWNHVTLLPGDCLLLPSKYIHQVRSYSRSISVSFLVSPSIKFDDHDCKPSNHSTMTADDVDVFWDRSSDHEFIDMGYINMKVFRKIVIGLMDFISIPCYNLSQLWKILSFALEMHQEESEEFFNKLDVNKDGCVDIIEAEHSDREYWKKLARSLDHPHGPTSLSEESKLESLNELKAKEGKDDDDDGLDFIRNFLHELSIYIDEDGNISYNKFLEMINGSDLVEFFTLIDINMDGVINKSELENCSSYTLRKLTRLGIRFTNSAEEFTNTGVESDDFKHYYRMIVKKCYYLLIRESRDYLIYGRFVQISRQIIHPRLNIDFNFLFRIINPREKVMWISKEDIRKLLIDEKLNNKLDMMDDISTRNEMLANLFSSIIFLAHPYSSV